MKISRVLNLCLMVILHNTVLADSHNINNNPPPVQDGGEENSGLCSASVIACPHDADFDRLSNMLSVPTPMENPLSEEKRILGKILFWDEPHFI